MLSRETDTELRPAKASYITWFRASNRIRHFQFFPPYIHQPSLIDSVETPGWTYFFIGSCYHQIDLFYVEFSGHSIQSHSVHHMSVPILLHHKLDSGQRRDPSWLQSAMRHPLVLDVFVYFSENLIASTRPTHPSPSKLIYSSLLWREVTGFDLGEEMKFEYSCVWTHYNRNQG